MRTLILFAAIPLILLGGCSTLRGKAGDHDAHHPKKAPVMQGAATPAPTADGMGIAANAGMMKNCPMMKADDKAPDDKMGAGMKGASGGTMKDCPPSDQMMANCPMMKDGAMMKGDKAGMPMSGEGMMKNCPMTDDKAKAAAPH